MGSTNFQHDVEIDELVSTVEDAWAKAREDAYYDSGHDPYNGTITTNSHYVIHTPGKVYDPAELIELINARLEVDDGPQKWGPCEVVATCQSAEDREQTGWTFYGWAAI